MKAWERLVVLMVGGFLTFDPIAAAPLNLDQVLERTRRAALEPQISQREAAKARSKANGILGIFDPQAFGEYQIGLDQTEGQNVLVGEKRSITQARGGVRQNLKTGTSIELSLTKGRQSARYPESGESGPNGGITAMLLEQLRPKRNPSFSTSLDLLLRQDLWRNFMGREVDLEHLRALALVSVLDLEKEARLQVVQWASAQLFWEAIAIEERLTLAGEILATSAKFVKAMEQSNRVGRINAVELAQARALLIAREGDLLNLELARDRVFGLLAARALGNPLEIVEIQGELAAPSLKALALPQTLDAALKLAETSRRELRQLEQQREPLGLAKDLVLEKDKPRLFVFGSVGFLKHGADEAESRESLLSQPRWAVGLGIDMTLGDTVTRAESAALLHEEAHLDLQKSQLVLQIQRDLKEVFVTIEGIEKRRQQFEDHERILADQVAAEKVRMRQARSDLGAVLRYELERMSVLMSQIEIEKSYRLAQARLRYLIHGYPMEGGA